MNRQLSLLVFAIPALFLFIAAAFMVLGGKRDAGGDAGAVAMGGV